MASDILSGDQHATWVAGRVIALVFVGVFLEITGWSLFYAGINKVLL